MMRKRKKEIEKEQQKHTYIFTLASNWLFADIAITVELSFFIHDSSHRYEH